MSDALINGLAGAGGGIISQLITYPLQTVNTRQQTEQRPKDASGELLITSKKLAKRNLGMIGQICQVVKLEGWGRLYGGLMPSLVGTAASQSVYYYFYQIFWTKAEAAAIARFSKGSGDGSVGMLSSLLVAALSGCLNVLLTNPIWLVVTRMQVQEVYDEAGVLGFWKGVVPTLIMVSNPSIQFMLYETMLKQLKRRRGLYKQGQHGATAFEIFFLGAIAKLGATVVTYPLLVVKSRLQVKQVKGGDKVHHYKGTIDAIWKMIQYEGLGGFYKGMNTKIVQSVLAAAILLMVKEELVKVARVLVTGNTGLVEKVKVRKL